jgi:hypothetical protein
MDAGWALGIALLVMGVALGGAGWHVGRLRREIVRQQALLGALERDLQAICQGARGMGDAVGRLEDKLRRLTERQDQLSLREPAQQAYHQAIRLAHRGASVEELVEACGLPRGEAELLRILHRAEVSGDPPDRPGPAQVAQRARP